MICRDQTRIGKDQFDMDENETHISRVTRPKEIARSSYNRLSRWYDLLAGKSEQPVSQEGLRLLRPMNGENILEIGFGTGHNLLGLAESVGESGHVHGIDLSEGMLIIARSRIERAGFAKRIELQCGDAASLPYETETFDAVFSAFTLELFDTPEIPVVLRECWRVLKWHGRICVVSMSKEGKSKFMLPLYEWAHEKIPNYVDCRPIFVRQSLSTANFDIQQCTYQSMWGLPVEIVFGRKA
jgi:ubiquinone/menaquinone biosynthesis C-methylase UbiE